MENRASKRIRRIVIQTAALGFALAIAVPAWAAPPTARTTRPPSGSGSSAGSSGSEASGSATSNTGGRTAVPRGSGSVDSGSNRGRTVRRPPSRRFGGRVGIDLGYYWGRPFYGHFGYYWHYYPYYPWGFAWYPSGPRYRVYGTDYGLGAIDLNVRPKKAEVYLDGELVGRSGKFDGFPGHLIVESGRYQIAFYHPGYETVVREVRVPAGVVVRVHLDLEPGEATPPQKLFAEREPIERKPMRPRPDDTDRSDSGREARPEGTARERTAERPSGALDVRGEPGRCRLAIFPPDASVYLDGRLLGSGQEMARLHSGLLVEPGEHTLEVVRPGYATRSLDFSVEEGGEVELEVRLEETK